MERIKPGRPSLESPTPPPSVVIALRLTVTMHNAIKARKGKMTISEYLRTIIEKGIK